MRVILLFLSILLFATAVYSAETPVAKDYFPEERIVNAVICSQYLLSKNNFLSCLNYLVCESEIVKYPKRRKIWVPDTYTQRRRLGGYCMGNTGMGSTPR